MNNRSRSPSGVPAGSVRIIGGRWRGTRLQVPSRPGLRPTSDRVRETLFNWLTPVLSGAKVLDLFAGSGALGLEAASRGASTACLVEADPQLARALTGVTERLEGGERVRVTCTDALAWLRNGSEGAFDIAFVDPPFDDGLWPQVFALLPARMTADAWLYVESPVDHAPGLPAEWALHREGATRDVRYALYRRVTLAPVHHGGNPATT